MKKNEKNDKRLKLQPINGLFPVPAAPPAGAREVGAAGFDGFEDNAIIGQCFLGTVFNNVHLLSEPFHFRFMETKWIDSSRQPFSALYFMSPYNRTTWI